MKRITAPQRMRLRITTTFLAVWVLLFFGWWVEAEGALPSRPSAKITRSETRSALMSFADRYISFVYQAADELSAEGTSFLARRAALRLKGHSVPAVIDIASDANPELALLDMLVMITLQRTVWETHWQAKVYKDAAAPVTQAFKILEKDVWSIGARILSEEQTKELKILIDQWRRTHPNQVYVEMVRLHDFDFSRRRSSTLVKTGLLRGLASIIPNLSLIDDETKENIQGFRTLAERSLFLFTHLYLTLSSQLELGLYEVITEPESLQILDNLEKIASEFRQLPENVQKERKAALAQFLNGLSQERKAAIEQLMSQISGERKEILASLKTENTELQKTLERVDTTLKRGTELTASVRSTVGALDTLRKGWDQSFGNDKGTTLNVAEYRQLLGEFQTSLNEANTLVKSIENLIKPQNISRAEDLADRFQGHDLVDHVFFRGLILIFVLLGGGVAAGLIYRAASQKMFPPSP